MWCSRLAPVCSSPSLGLGCRRQVDHHQSRHRSGRDGSPGASPRSGSSAMPPWCSDASLAHLEKLSPDAARARRGQAARVKDAVAADLAVLAPQLGYLRAIRDVLPDNGVVIDEFELRSAMRPATLTRRVRRAPTSPPATRARSAGAWPPRSAPSTRSAMCRSLRSRAMAASCSMCGEELATAVRHRIPVVVIIFNDGAYGNVRNMQRDLHGNRLHRLRPCQSGFRAASAESFGI